MQRTNVALVTFGVVLTLTVVNLLVHPHFLGPADDWLGDFLKLSLSYPGFEKAHSIFRPDLIAKYKIHNPLSDILLQPGGAAISPITHYHEPPVPTLIALLSVRAMAFFDAVGLYMVLAGAVVAWTAVVVGSAGRTAGERLLLAATSIIAYPTLFMLDRGNLFAGVTTAAILQMLVLTVRGKHTILSAVLLALAINIRPNLIVFLLPFVAFGPQWRWRLVPLTIVLTVATLFAALALDHALYPNYSLASFREGLAVYNRIVVGGPAGLPGGSSLMTPLQFMFGFHPAYISSLLTGGAFGLLAIWLSFRNADKAVTIFVVCTALTFGSTIFGDYHLGLFLAVPVMLLMDAREMTPSRMAVILTTALVLAPKNEFYYPNSPFSYQVLINPVLLLATALFVAVTWRRSLDDSTGLSRSQIRRSGAAG